MSIPSVKVTEIDLEILKNYLRIDFDYDDVFLETILAASKSFIQSYLNKRFDEFDELPYEFTISCLALCAHWYENKRIENKRDSKESIYVFAGILDMHREWLGAD